MHKNMSAISWFIAVSLVLILTAGIASAATETYKISYSGKLTSAAGTALTGTYNVTFRLYNVASGGGVLATDAHNVTASGGQFTTTLIFPAANYNGQQLYVSLQRSPDPEKSRTVIYPVPYALGLRPGAIVSGSGTTPVLQLVRSGPGGMGLDVRTSGTRTTGVTASAEGDNSVGLGTSARGILSEGVRVYTLGDSSRGVNVSASGDYSNGVKVYTQGDNTNGVIVDAWGWGSHGVETNTHDYYSNGIESLTGGKGSWGVYTQTSGDESDGVVVNTVGDNSHGVVAHTLQDNSDGVVVNTIGDSSHGVYAYTDGIDSRGVYGISEQSIGVQGNGTNAAGVHGVSTNKAGVWGLSENDVGLYGETSRADHMYGIMTRDYMSAARYDTNAGDVAEYMQVSGDTGPGTVLVIGKGGVLSPSSIAYDTRVAGIVSTTPGVALGTREGGNPGEQIIAVAGRVPCRVDASNGAIQEGDLLTTSSRPGYAMKATSPRIGTVLGKAMGTLESGTGTIDVLVTLQ
jgi:hypothetical protein